MKRFLLDVNVLIALIDPAHIQHDRVHAWFGASGAGAWASCPITQNGVLRIVGHPRYPNSPGSPAAVATLVSGLLAQPGHKFWPDDLTLMDTSQVDAARLLDSGQVIDTYLLALAVAHGGLLATLVRSIIPPPCSRVPHRCT